MNRLTFLLFFIFSGSGLLEAQDISKATLIKLDNFHQVDVDIFRSGQPNATEFKALEKAGIKQVLNLRNHHTDTQEAAGTTLELFRIKMNAGSLTEDDLLAAMRIIKERTGPLLIHCWHGSDRTGAVVATYRMVFQNWTKEKAIAELVHGGFGYHAKYYQNIPKLLERIDVEEFRQKLNSEK